MQCHLQLRFKFLVTYELSIAATTTFQRLMVQGFVVEVVFTVARSNTLQVGDVASDLLDGLDLLTKELGFNKVGHLWNNENFGYSYNALGWRGGEREHTTGMSKRTW